MFDYVRILVWVGFGLGLGLGSGSGWVWVEFRFGVEFGLGLGLRFLHTTISNRSNRFSYTGPTTRLQLYRQ